MKIIQLYGLLICICLLYSCDTKQKSTEENAISNNWESFIVETKFQKIEIKNYSDSIYYTNRIYKDGLDNIPPKYELDKIESGTILLTEQQKDSLIFHIKNTITNPTFTNAFVTDYVGNVSFSLNKNNMKLICQYNAVGDWTTVSNDTKRIYELINKHIKVSIQ